MSAWYFINATFKNDFKISNLLKNECSFNIKRIKQIVEQTSLHLYNFPNLRLILFSWIETLYLTLPYIYVNQITFLHRHISANWSPYTNSQPHGNSLGELSKCSKIYTMSSRCWFIKDQYRIDRGVIDFFCQPIKDIFNIVSLPGSQNRQHHHEFCKGLFIRWSVVHFDIKNNDSTKQDHCKSFDVN